MRLYMRSPLVRQNLYHFEWCPKKALFRNELLCRKRREEILREVAERRGIEIINISVMSDHGHLIADVPPTMSVSEALRLLKGGSSYELFRAKPNFRKRYPKGHFWSPGKFYRSVGDSDLETTRNYVRNQGEVHGSESWEGITKENTVT
jgi:putative transposase